MDEQKRQHAPNPNADRQAGMRQEPGERIKNFDEVAQGLTDGQAAAEANRCLNCKNAKCAQACPVNVRIPEFIACVKAGDPAGGAAKILETNLLPAVCGRVCPQESHCEGACVLNAKSKPVAIGLLERYAADVARKSGSLQTPQCAPPTGFKVAAVGSGPAALALAAELARQGHKVTVFEALHSLGGVLRYGIPTFRLPRKTIDAELATAAAMGVEFVADVLIGATLSVEDLLAGYDAVFIGTGAGRPTMLEIPGENSAGVYSANEFLTRINLMRADLFPRTDTPVAVGKKVLVIGGGNAAMDGARCAMRFGPESVTVVYRRSEQEMPARKEEAANAKEENVKFEFLAAPLEIQADAKGRVKSVRFAKMRLGEPDASGRRQPVQIAESEFTLEADTVIVAIGQQPNPVIQKTTPGLATGRKGVLATDEWGRTSRVGIFAGGDIIRGGATVLLAMRDGKKAAQAIHQYLLSKHAKSTV